MGEAEVKAALLQVVRSRLKRQPKPPVTLEFSLGTSGVRADLAVFGDVAIGFEIKTAKDSLRRLPEQMAAYTRYFNQAIAIIAERHLAKIRSDDLCGASLWTYDSDGKFRIIEPGAMKPVVDLRNLEDLLTKAERRKMDFRAAMEARYGCTSRRFWLATSRRSIRTQDLSLLSRFSDSRAMAAEAAVAREARWAEWLAAQELAAGVSA